MNAAKYLMPPLAAAALNATDIITKLAIINIMVASEVCERSSYKIFVNEKMSKQLKKDPMGLF
jgi:hypothetical protein